MGTSQICSDPPSLCTSSAQPPFSSQLLELHDAVAKRPLRTTAVVAAPLLSFLSFLVIVSLTDLPATNRISVASLRTSFLRAAKIKGLFNDATPIESSPQPLPTAPPGRVPANLLFDKEPNNFGHSLFLTGATARFGTRRVYYRTIDIDTAPENDSAVADQIQVTAPIARDRAVPCLLVTSHPDTALPWRNKHVPHCRVFLIKDEFCNASDVTQTSGQVDFRQYDTGNTQSQNQAPSLYVPLGPRIDFFEALIHVVNDVAQQKGSSSTVFPLDQFSSLPPHLPLASNRQKVLNAVFSKDTSASRMSLAAVLESNETNHTALFSPANSTIQIASAWSNNLSTGQMTPVEYVDVLRNSVFTLSPVGHNAESYRLFEAAEAGSIPVIALDQVYKSHACKDSLQMMRASAPDAILWLNTWEELPEQLMQLLGDKERLNQMQREVRLWYQRFMTGRIRTFEEALLSADDQPGLADVR